MQHGNSGSGSRGGEVRGQGGDLPPCPAADTVGSYAFCKLAQHLYCSCAADCAPMSTSTSTRYILLPARGDVCGAAPSPTLCILGGRTGKPGKQSFLLPLTRQLPLDNWTTSTSLPPSYAAFFHNPTKRRKRGVAESARLRGGMSLRSMIQYV